MDEMTALQGRITAALDKIGAHYEQIVKHECPEQESALIMLELQEERNQNKKLSDQLDEITEQLDKNNKSSQKILSTYKRQVDLLDTELQKVRRSHEQMCTTNAQLREAIAEGLTTPELIDQAMKSELEALRAQNSLHAAEVKAVFEELKPLVGV